MLGALALRAPLRYCHGLHRCCRRLAPAGVIENAARPVCRRRRFAFLGGGTLSKLFEIVEAVAPSARAGSASWRADASQMPAAESFGRHAEKSGGALHVCSTARFGRSALQPLDAGA